MPTTTETPRGERLAAILLHLIRNRRRRFTVAEMHDHLNRSEPVILRNVQRDCKTLAGPSIQDDSYTNSDPDWNQHEIINTTLMIPPLFSANEKCIL